MKAPVADVGQWLLICGQNGDRIVRAGDVNFGPSAVRRSCTAAVRLALLPVANRAFESGTTISTAVEHDGRPFTAVTSTIRTPLSSTPVAVQTILVEEGMPVPPRPDVGSWEWTITLDDHGEPTLERTTYWDETLFQIYNVSPDTSQHKAGCWEVGVWQQELVSQADQIRLFGLIRDGIREGICGVRGLTFNVLTGYGTDNPGRQHLRLLGRIASEKRDGRMLLQGISYAVPDAFTEDAYEHDAARVDDVLRGVLQLCDDPLAVVDPETFEILMTSPTWRKASLMKVPSVLDLFTEHSITVRDFLEGAADDEDTREFPNTLTVRKSDGTTQDATLSVCGVRASDGTSMDTLVRLAF